jgi:hypothetical protein
MNQECDIKDQSIQEIPVCVTIFSPYPDDEVSGIIKDLDYNLIKRPR